MGNKRLIINMIANLLAFFVSAGINFVIAPYLINTVGSEAYGFVGLATNFVSYASLMTIALNSMAGRFISIKIHQSDYEGAKGYYNSVLMANTVMSILLIFPSIFCVLFLNKILNISDEIYFDVQMLFALLFLNFIISTLGSTFSVATFTRNRLDLSSMRSIESNLLKVVVLVILFYFFNPSITYIGVATFLSTLYIVITNIYYTKILVPELRISKKYYNFKLVLELISSGIWNTIIRVGQLLLGGLDLLISNIFIGAAAMGTLAISRTVPMFITSLVAILASVFMPMFTIDFAKNNISGLIKDIKQSMKILGILIAVPISLLIVYGDIFYSLWVPTEDASLLQNLSVVSVITIAFSGSINTIYNIFTVTNKLKANAMWLIITGLINTLIVFLLLKTTTLGLYAIVGVSTIISILRNLLFTAPYGAKCLNVKWNMFYPEIFKSILSVIIGIIVALPFKVLLNVDSWLQLALIVIISALIGICLNILLILNKREREIFIRLIKNKLIGK